MSNALIEKLTKPGLITPLAYVDDVILPRSSSDEDAADEDAAGGAGGAGKGCRWLRSCPADLGLALGKPFGVFGHPEDGPCDVPHSGHPWRRLLPATSEPSAAHSPEQSTSVS